MYGIPEKSNEMEFRIEHNLENYQINLSFRFYDNSPLLD